MPVQTPPRVDRSSARRPSELVWVLGAAVTRPWLITAALCAVLLALPATGGDLAAQEFHSWAFGARGALLWNNYWYSGHLLGGYSLLFPPLGALVGTRLLGALACVGASAAATALFGGARAGRGAQLAAVWFAVGIVSPFVVGQLPFLVGFAAALAALLAAVRRRPWLAATAALAASLTSPLAGAFLLLAGVAWCAEAGARRTAPLATAAIGIGFASLLGGGGYFPFPASSLLVLLLFTVGGLVLVPDLPPTLRWGLLLYGICAVAIFSTPNPVGGNVARLGALVAGPLAAATLGARRRWPLLVLVGVPLLCWQVWPAATALSRSAGDPSNRAAYYAGLDAFLRTQDVGSGRVEIPTLRQHWEASYVARVFPLARGWERQIDLRDNATLYRPHLSSGELHDWLVRSGVAFVALPDAPLDYWSRAEGDLLADGQPWLTPVWSDAHWRVWRFADAPGMVTGPARLTRLGLESFDLAADRAGAAVVRVHWSPYWQVTSGHACLRPGPDGWISVQTSEPGPITVTARWSLPAAIRPSVAVGRCA